MQKGPLASIPEGRANYNYDRWKGGGKATEVSVSQSPSGKAIVTPNPYQSPNSPNSPTRSGPPLWRYFAVLLWIPVPFLGGIAGLFVGYVFWSQFFWDDGPPVPFLSFTGFLLTLITGLVGFLAFVVLAVLKGGQLLE